MDEFYDLFEGNPNAYGTDTAVGVKCVRGDARAAVNELHIPGIQSVGIYPMYDNQVKWGCTDIDNGSLEDAKTMHRILTRMDLHPWIEVSKSKGYHVWVFGEEFMPAWYMRRAFLFAHHVSAQMGTPVAPSEVNPKQEWLEDGQLGNFVRVPFYGGTRDSNGRRVMLASDGVVPTPSFVPVELPYFVREAHSHRVRPSAVREWAVRYAPPKQHGSWNSGEPSASAEELAGRLTGLGYRIFRDGPPEWDSRRSQAMCRLAIECAKSNLTQDEALVLVADLDERLGKWGREAPRRTCVEWGYNQVREGQ